MKDKILNALGKLSDVLEEVMGEIEELDEAEDAVEAVAVQYNVEFRVNDEVTLCGRIKHGYGRVLAVGNDLLPGQPAPHIRVQPNDGGKVVLYNGTDIANGTVVKGHRNIAAAAPAVAARVAPRPYVAPAPVRVEPPLFMRGDRVRVEGRLGRSEGVVEAYYPNGKPGKGGQGNPQVDVRWNAPYGIRRGKLVHYNGDDIRAGKVVRI